MKCHPDCGICAEPRLPRTAAFEDEPRRFGTLILGAMLFAAVVAAMVVGAALGMAAHASGVETCAAAIRTVPGERM